MRFFRRRLPVARAVAAAGTVLVLGGGAAALTLALAGGVLRPGPDGGHGVRLHNGWRISPAGAAPTLLNDMPVALALRPNGKTLAVVSGGAAAHRVYLIDVATGKIGQSVPVDRAQSSGIAWSGDGNMLYVAGGNSGKIHVLTVTPEGQATPAPALLVADTSAAKPDPPTADTIPNPVLYLSGLALARDEKTLFVADLATDTVRALELPGGKPGVTRKLTSGDRPGCLRLSPDGSELYAALWARDRVLVLDPATLETRRTITLGAHPNDLLFAPDGRLFVSCGNADAVFVIGPNGAAEREKIATTLTPRAPAGSTPASLALSPDGKSLYVACSDNNAVAVLDVSRPGHSVVRGFVPTAQYPTLVAAKPNGTDLFVACGKGLGTGPNPAAKGDPPNRFPYIMTLLRGTLATIPVPNETMLAAYTKQVLANSRYTSDALLERPANAPRPGDSPVPSRVGDASPIRHVVYIIKENRTYDQVFGDMKEGNGDPNLVLFGENVTPNHHALAREYVLLDNLYADGEVSVDGHHWSNGAYVPDAMQRTWPAQYGGKGAPPIRYGDFGDGLAETPSGRIWDRVAQRGLDFRTYYYHVDKNKSDEWAAARKRRERDYVAADIFIKDLAAWDKAGKMPSFLVMALSEDHTTGTRPGAFTPQACVASNDLALGKIVEACSKSKFWPRMAVFVIEDDAQNGPDHVDAHRTVGLVISPYTHHGGGKVDSTFYSTTSFLRTMELILGLPPMSQFDASAAPLYASFRRAPDPTPYVSRPARIDLAAKNPPNAVGARASRALDFSAPDRLSRQDEDTLNRVLWHSIKGPNAPYPGVTRRALLTPSGRSLVSARPIADPAEEDESAEH